jgi:hypothetical protein
MDLNRLAAMQDFADPMGGAFEPAAVNIGAGPRIIEDSTRRTILNAQDTLYERFTIGTEANTRVEQFLMNKGYDEDARKKLTVPLVSAVKDPTLAGGQEEILSLSQEFKQRMQFEAFEKATEAYNYGRDEIQQISPTYLTLYDKYKGAETKIKKPSQKAISTLLSDPQRYKDDFIEEFGIAEYEKAMRV